MLKHLDNGSVRILVETNVPAPAIAVLGKGLGYVPTPKPDAIELRLDPRRLVNKLLYKTVENSGTQEDLTNDENSTDDEDIFHMPAKLRQTNYFLASHTNTDPEINMAINHITANANSAYFDKKSVSMGTFRMLK